jgi:hypothetical protein
MQNTILRILNKQQATHKRGETRNNKQSNAKEGQTPNAKFMTPLNASVRMAAHPPGGHLEAAAG